MRVFALFLIVTARRAGAAWRRWLFGCAYPGLRLDRSVEIERGARIQVTDGGTLEIGPRTTIGAQALIVVKSGAMRIGADGFIGPGSVLACADRLDIGRDALIAEFVTIRDHAHGIEGDGPYRAQPNQTAPVSIGDNVWLGAKATVLKGVSIGDGAVIGAGAVVTRDIAPGIRAAGVPARPL